MVTTHLATMEEYMKKKHNAVVELVNYLELTDDTMQLFDLLMTMMLEDRMGAVVYMQDLVDQSYAFRRGVQALLQGKLTIDLVPPTLIKTAITEVTAYLNREHPRYLRVQHSITTTANHCSSGRMRHWWCSCACLLCLKNTYSSSTKF